MELAEQGDRDKVWVRLSPSSELQRDQEYRQRDIDGGEQDGQPTMQVLLWPWRVLPYAVTCQAEDTTGYEVACSETGREVYVGEVPSDTDDRESSGKDHQPPRRGK